MLATGARTGLTGTYNVKYTYCRKEGNTIVSESNPSDAGTEVTLANESLQIKLDPVTITSTDSQISAARIYRTENTGIDYYFLDTITFPSSDRAYSYCYDWEMTDAYISGTGYKFTQNTEYSERITISNCDAFDSDSIWNVIQDSTISYDGTTKMEGTTSLNMLISGGKNGIIKCTKASGVWDLSGYDTINLWLYTASAITSQVYLYMGKSAYNEQTTGVFSLSAGWTKKTWDISAIADEDKNAITMFAIRDDNGLNPDNLKIDDIYVETTGYSYEGIQRTYGWEPIEETDIEEAIGLHWWEPVIIDTNVADTALGTEVDEDHDKPPSGTFVFGPSFTGMCFMLKDNLMYYSLEKTPEYWPVSHYLEICSMDYDVISGTIFDGQIYVATEHDIYLIPGTSHATFGAPLTMSAITGTISPNCFLGVHGYGVFHLGNDGIYLLSSGKDEPVTHERFKPIFEGTTVGSIPGVDKTNLKNSWITFFKNKLYFCYPKSGSTYPDNMIVTDLRTGKSSHYDYGETFPCVGIDYANKRLLACDTSGYVWEIEHEDSTNDNGTTISWQIETKEYSDQLRKYFPRNARYDVNLGTEATANGYILLNGTSKQTHAITESRITKKRLITGCTGDRIAVRVTGTGPVDIYSMEVE